MMMATPCCQETVAAILRPSSALVLILLASTQLQVVQPFTVVGFHSRWRGCTDRSPSNDVNYGRKAFQNDHRAYQTMTLLRSEQPSSSFDSPEASSAGPKGVSGRTRRTPRERPIRTTTAGSRRVKAETAAFDGKLLSIKQLANENQPSILDLAKALDTNILKCRAEGDLQFSPTSTTTTVSSSPKMAWTSVSLDDLFPQFQQPDGQPSALQLSSIFNADSVFRDALRLAIRQDIFDTTPYYANLSEKAASILLLPDSSLEGSWNPKAVFADASPNKNDQPELRMKRTTKVLHDTFEEYDVDTNGLAWPTGDDLMAAIGGLCGSKPSTHWIDIVGVLDRKINHSWHQDSGRSPESSKTVLWGFPPEDGYTGCGVFSHIVPLKEECRAPEGHSRMEPVLFEGTVDEEFVIRPTYAAGRELIMYRDIDVLHSSPDVAYRTSIMRFM